MTPLAGDGLHWVISAGVWGGALIAASLAIAFASPGGAAARLGWRRGRLNRTAVVTGVFAVVALSHGVDASLRAAGYGPVPASMRLVDTLRGLPLGDLALVGIALGLVVPLGEELLFRGVVQRGLARRIDPRAAWIAASALFGAAHGDVALGVGAFLLGLVLGWLFDRGGSLWLPVAAHAANNLIALTEARLFGVGGVEGAGLAAAAGIGIGSWALWRAGRALGPSRAGLGA